MEKIDYKRQFKEFYDPKTTPTLIDVPEMTFIAVDGKGDPNDKDGEYQAAVEIIYALSYTIKMAPKSNIDIEGYNEYVMPPLEGLWWFADYSSTAEDKSKYCWTSMVRQPDFVTQEVFELAKALVKKKKPGLDTTKARFHTFTEGLCVQCMHIGPFADEPVTLAKMKDYTANNSFVFDLSGTRKHHEIYSSDPRKADAAKMKTILRYPVRTK